MFCFLVAFMNYANKLDYIINEYALFHRHALTGFSVLIRNPFDYIQFMFYKPMHLLLSHDLHVQFEKRSETSTRFSKPDDPATEPDRNFLFRRQYEDAPVMLDAPRRRVSAYGHGLSMHGARREIGSSKSLGLWQISTFSDDSSRYRRHLRYCSRRLS
ncbi:hypothetical protein RchiOBHm_Chr1g0347851 [Rosa chinensis]|uniref:Uncharacterized protein n=1 Tax=Rosa chinensis TaxID=74649 RepID=A0A2P6SFD8_ROSCH|nr:hypothetical protein RchiOBHm_Chr1g0347851 [Rosa chinensis]